MHCTPPIIFNNHQKRSARGLSIHGQPFLPPSDRRQLVGLFARPTSLMEGNPLQVVQPRATSKPVTGMPASNKPATAEVGEGNELGSCGDKESKNKNVS